MNMKLYCYHCLLRLNKKRLTISDKPFPDILLHTHQAPPTSFAGINDDDDV